MESNTPKPIDPEIGRRYVESWKAAGEFLEAERRARLRAMTDEQAREAMHALLSIPLPADLPPRVCGLVEQQNWFKKLHPR